MGIRSKPVKIIHDCDPGHDDAVAILMAAVHPAIDLQAVTVVAGNQTLEKTVRNALNICSASGRFSDIPVAAGMSRPMVREQVVAGDIHGESGLDGPVFDEPDVGLDPRHAVDLIIDLLLDSDDPITIVPTGPLTNIGMAIRKEPDIVEKIERIVLMGGAYQHGNVTPSAEFNIYADPEAAHVVFTCGRPIVMMGLDVTRKALATPAMIATSTRGRRRVRTMKSCWSVPWPMTDFTTPEMGIGKLPSVIAQQARATRTAAAMIVIVTTRRLKRKDTPPRRRARTFGPCAKMARCVAITGSLRAANGR